MSATVARSSSRSGDGAASRSEAVSALARLAASGWVSSCTSEAANTPIVPTRAAWAACACASCSRRSASWRASTLANTSPRSCTRGTSASGQSRSSRAVAKDERPHDRAGNRERHDYRGAHGERAQRRQIRGGLGRKVLVAAEAHDRAGDELRADPGHLRLHPLAPAGRARPRPATGASSRTRLLSPRRCHRVARSAPSSSAVSRRPASITRSCSERAAVSSARQEVGHRALEGDRRLERFLRALVRERVAEDRRQDADAFDQILRPGTLVPHAVEGRSRPRSVRRR